MTFQDAPSVPSTTTELAESVSGAPGVQAKAISKSAHVVFL